MFEHDIVEAGLMTADTVIKFSDSVTVGKRTEVSVPTGFVGIVLINNEPTRARLEPCSCTRLSEVSRDYLGKECRIAFLRSGVLEPIRWGVGNILATDKDMLVCKIGCNGFLELSVTGIADLLCASGFNTTVTTAEIKALIRGSLSEAVSAALAGLLSKYSVSELSLCRNELSSAIGDRLTASGRLVALGLTLSSVTVAGITDPIY